MVDNKIIFDAAFDSATSTITYLIADPVAKKAAIIDPVLDYDQNTGTVDTKSVEAMLAKCDELGLQVVWTLETHVHADHLSGSPYIKAKTGAKIGIGANITKVQTIFRPVFNAMDLQTDGSDFDHLFENGEHFALGAINIEVLDTPGHTPADISYKIGDRVFVGDTFFMPDYGTARADFPGGDARQLFRSIQKLLALPDETKLFMCHDYLTDTRKVHAWQSSVKAQKNNIHLAGGVTEDAFVEMREARDKNLAAPKLLLPSIQVNMRAGNFPKAEANGVHYLKVPVKAKNPEQAETLGLS